MVQLTFDSVSYLMEYGRSQTLPKQQQQQKKTLDILSLSNPEWRFLTSVLAVQEKPLAGSCSKDPLPKAEVLLTFLDINLTLTTPHE